MLHYFSDWIADGKKGKEIKIILGNNVVFVLDMYFLLT